MYYTYLQIKHIIINYVVLLYSYFICYTDIQVLTAYRKEFGIESLRRCGTCMEGVGMKLKRCAKCPEMYCSRECQTYAWDEEGHKQLCNYTLDENNSE